ncbi:hypothetical protein [Antribacter gilvus]|uniref:hypothetical protein n=1 Tax=Antribacter gilvus TaxID=2304675 RepID=UPI000F7817B1|nr:hypothetical protein [Antribacter gilvus]
MNAIALTVRDWKSLIAKVKPHASRGELPLLSSVRLFEHKGHLAALATDRYTLGVAYERGVTVPEGFDAVIPLDAITEAERMARMPARMAHGHHVTIEVDGGNVSISVTRVAGGSLSLTTTTREGYPDVLRLIAGFDEGGDPAPLTFDARHVAKFQSAGAALVCERRGKLVLIRTNEDFIGLLVLMSGGGEIRDAWDDLLAGGAK